MVRRMFIVKDARICDGSHGGGLVVGCGDGGVCCRNPNVLSIYLTSWPHVECIALVGGCTPTTVRPVRHACLSVRSRIFDFRLFVATRPMLRQPILVFLIDLATTPTWQSLIISNKMGRVTQPHLPCNTKHQSSVEEVTSNPKLGPTRCWIGK